MLAHEKKRALYDYERWLSGRFTKNAAAISPEYLLQEVNKLNAHIAEIDVYRMNKELLQHYLLFLLSDEKIAIIQRKASRETISGLVTAMMRPAGILPVYFARPVLLRLTTITEGYPEEAHKINLRLKKLLREARWQRLFPWLVLLATLLLCLAMFLFSRK